MHMYIPEDDMNTSNLALINAGLLVVQAVVNIAYAKYFVLLAREYQTLISPASFAFAIWIVIYALEVLLVLVDVLYPQYSLYAEASQPTQLRCCFALTCIFNTLWLIFYVNNRVHAATVMIFLLWLALLMLYIYSINDRNARSEFDWRLYLCNELPIAIYIAWVTAMAFNHLAISLQTARGGYLSISVYVIHLTIVSVFALLAIIYAQDPAFVAVVVWYLVAVTTRHIQVPTAQREADMSLKACAGEAAAIIAVLLVVTFLHLLLYRGNKSSSTTHMEGLASGQGADYGSTLERD